MKRGIEIGFGQAWRSLTHIRRFRAAIRRPAQTQAEKLLSIIRANENTAFGKKHGFDRIASVADFQSRVPPAEYEYLEPYIEASMRGERAQLTADEPFMYATTSGTTSRPKFIPINESHLRDYTHAFHVHNYHLIADNPLAALGQYMIISSNDREGTVPCGKPYGAVSGLLNRRQSSLVRRFFALPYEICQVRQVDMKYYLMLRAAMAQNVTAILCCNPSSLLLLADQLGEQAGELIRDIRDGTLNPAFAPDPAIARAFAPYLRPDKPLADRLSRLLEKEGRLLPRLVWPGLGVISCWKGGPMSFYLDRLGQSYGQIAVRDFGYMASEGRGSIPLADEGAGGVAALTSHFFEFVPEDEMDGPARSYKTLDQIAVGRRYYIHFTTAAGLYRYNINDLVEVVGMHERTPVIEFVRKGAGISSITGEKLTEEHVRLALDFARRQLGISGLKHFTAAVSLGHPPYYACFAEFDCALAEPVRAEFMRVFDQSLRSQNPEYQDKRATRRLGLPALFTVPAGTYTGLRQERVLAGAPEAQVKIPLLASTGTFADRLFALSPLAGASRGGDGG